MFYNIAIVTTFTFGIFFYADSKSFENAMTSRATVPVFNKTVTEVCTAVLQKMLNTTEDSSNAVKTTAPETATEKPACICRKPRPGPPGPGPPRPGKHRPGKPIPGPTPRPRTPKKTESTTTATPKTTVEKKFNIVQPRPFPVVPEVGETTTALPQTSTEKLTDLVTPRTFPVKRRKITTMGPPVPSVTDTPTDLSSVSGYTVQPPIIDNAIHNSSTKNALTFRATVPVFNKTVAEICTAVLQKMLNTTVDSANAVKTTVPETATEKPKCICRKPIPGPPRPGPPTWATPGPPRPGKHRPGKHRPGKHRPGTTPRPTKPKKTESTTTATPKTTVEKKINIIQPRPFPVVPEVGETMTAIPQISTEKLTDVVTPSSFSVKRRKITTTRPTTDTPTDLSSVSGYTVQPPIIDNTIYVSERIKADTGSSSSYCILPKYTAFILSSIVVIYLR